MAVFEKRQAVTIVGDGLGRLRLAHVAQ